MDTVRVSDCIMRLYIAIAFLSISFCSQGQNTVPYGILSARASTSPIKSRTITLNSSATGTADVSNFPLTFYFSGTTYKDVAHGGNVYRADGYDIVFYSDAGHTTLLTWKVIFYDNINGILEVKMPWTTLSHTADGFVYQQYGSTSITTFQGGSPTFTNIVGYWPHPDGTTLSATDITGNGYNGTITGATATTGQVDGGGNYPSTGNYTVITGGSAFRPTNNISISAWGSNTTNGDAWNKAFIMPYGNTSWTSPYYSYQITLEGGKIEVGFNVDNNYAHGACKSTTTISTNTWTHIAGTFNSGIIKLYINGALDKTCDVTAWGTAVVYAGTPRSNPVIGTDANYFDAERWVGKLDEIFMMNTDVTASFWTAYYNMTKASESLYTIGSES